MTKQKAKRWNAKRKKEFVLELLRGRPIKEFSREHEQPAHVISEWRERFSQSLALPNLITILSVTKIVNLEQRLARLS